jgi:parallel beta-helix repeat protein
MLTGIIGWTHPSPDGSVTQVENFTRGLDSSVLTSDYALYWFDYRVGYDTVLTQFGWNNSRQLQISLIRGAAAAYDKNWGAIVTWTYSQPPYLESEGQLYDDMVLAYNSGAKYIAIYDSTKDYQNSTLTEEHFKALQNFWSYTQHNPDKQGSLKADTALVLPQDYAFGFRSPNDSVWRYRQADNWTRKMYNDVTILLNQYDSGLDIVYSDQGFQNSIQSKYSKVLRWPQNFETNINFSVTNLNNGLGYNTIQEALSSYATYAGDTIFVKPGTYHENIVITKSVSLTNQNQDPAIIDGSGNDTALTIVSDNVTMTGFIVQNDGNLSALVGAGILLLNAHNCTVTNNTVHNNYAGIVIANSSGNVLRRNNISDNMVNLVLMNTSSNDIDSSNIVDGKPYTVG